MFTLSATGPVLQVLHYSGIDGLLYIGGSDRVSVAAVPLIAVLSDNQQALVSCLENAGLTVEPDYAADAHKALREASYRVVPNAVVA